MFDANANLRSTFDHKQKVIKMSTCYMIVYHCMVFGFGTFPENWAVLDFS